MRKRKGKSKKSLIPLLQNIAKGLQILVFLVVLGLVAWGVRDSRQNFDIFRNKTSTTQSTPKGSTSSIEMKQEVVGAPITPEQPSPSDSTAWGVSKQVGDDSWTIKLGADERMAEPSEILVALNNYRRVHGSGPLSIDNNLASYAQERAAFFDKKGILDEHAGFKDYLDNQDGFRKLGFSELGENSSIGYKLLAVHLIEWMYAGDEPHNRNQLDNKWEFVGIGVSGSATDLVFGRGKI